MRNNLFPLSFLVLPLAACASSEEPRGPSGLYARANLGYGKTSDGSFDPGGATANGEYSPGMMSGAAVGYDINKRWGVEADWTYRSGDIDFMAGVFQLLGQVRAQGCVVFDPEDPHVAKLSSRTNLRSAPTRRGNGKLRIDAESTVVRRAHVMAPAQPPQETSAACGWRTPRARASPAPR